MQQETPVLHTARGGGTSTGGSIIVVTIVFMAVFVTMFGPLIGYLAVQYKWVESKTEQERALQIAEAGIEYYRWRLSHFPDDIQDGTGAPGPYVHVYDDPEEGPIGEFSLEVGGEVFCDEVQVVYATSTGYTYKDPDLTRTIVVKIARPTVADYSYIVDSPVIAGSSRTIVGPYHGNSLVKMEGNNLSAVTSRLVTGSCTLLNDCPGTKNGVYGPGTNPQWWQWGVAEIPFSNFDTVFNSVKDKAVASGLYYPKISDGTNGPYYGYYLELQDDKTVDVYKVDSVDWKEINTPADGDSNPDLPELVGPQSYSHSGLDSLREVEAVNVPIPQDCPVIYIEDNVWLEGEVSGKVTVVANDDGSAEPDLFLQDNITYETGGGVDGLTVLAERHLFIPFYVPDDMTINGVFFAQKGSYGRPSYYCESFTWWGACNDTMYLTYRLRNELTTNGTVISKLRTGTAWGTTQGFSVRNDNYDRYLADSPPPRTPYTSPNFRFIEWREVE